jgi:hypothetical protein
MIQMMRRGLEKGPSMSVSDAGVKFPIVIYKDISALDAHIVVIEFSVKLEHLLLRE